MLSINSLAENFLPNLYVKSLDLQTFSATTATDREAPRHQGAGFSSPEKGANTRFQIGSSKTYSQSNIALSVKNLKTDTYSEEIIELLNSEFSDDIKIFAHQITDRFLYENILQALTPGVNLNNINSIANLEFPAEAEFKSIMDLLTREDSKIYIDGLKTQVFNFLDIPLWNKFNTNSTTNTIKTTEQILSDGTIINEGILNLTFKFKKDTSFLAYLFIVGLKSTGGLAAVNATSKPTAEVVLIDGKFQTTGVIFTISQDQAGRSFDELTNYGKAGDVWGGGVHIHEGRYMAGTMHSSQPHAFLDLQFVDVAKYTDNRILDRSVLTPFNVTKELNTVETSVNVFKNNLKLLNFSQYKQKNHAGEIIFSQDQDKNVNGVFFIDKHEIIKNNSAFPFIIQNIELAYDQNQNKSSEKDKINDLISSDTRIISLNVYGPYYEESYAIEDELLKTMGESEINSTLGLKSLGLTSSDSKDIFKIKKITGLGIKPNENEIDGFIFKHHIGKSLANSIKLKYRYTVEYQDPTIIFMKRVLLLIKKAKRDTQRFINYVQSVLGFDEYTQKVKDEILNAIIPNNFDWVSNAGEPYYVKGVFELANSPFPYVIFYNANAGKKTISKSEFSKQLKRLCRIDNTNLDKVNILFTFLSNMESTLEKALSSVTVKKQSKSSGATENNYDEIKMFGDVFSNRSTKTIKQESKQSHITIADHGYDFTGYFKRSKDDFYKITSSEFINKCNTLFSTQFSTLSGDDQFTNESIEEALDLTFKPKGFTDKTPRENMYTFLNIPVENKKLKKCIMLPETVISKDLDVVNLQHILLSIIKNKKQILINNCTICHNAEKIILEDLLSILGSEGGDQNSMGVLEKSSSEAVSQTSNNSLLQKDFSFATSQDLGNSTEVQPTSLASAVLKNNFFKLSPPKTIKLVDSLPNYILLSMLYRKLFSNTANQMSFKLNISEPDFEPWKTFEQLVEYLPAVPLNTLCLSIDDDNFGSLKDFMSGDQTYIKNGVINPALMSYFWFIHQNIVIVEYLEDFEVEEETSLLEIDSDTPINDSGDSITIKRRNIQKPIFKPITNSLLNSKNIGDKLMCRLRQYENSTYVNKKLLDELKMPLINNYFILEIQ